MPPMSFHWYIRYFESLTHGKDAFDLQVMKTGYVQSRVMKTWQNRVTSARIVFLARTMAFPILPELQTYPVSVGQAYQTLQNIYERADDVLEQHTTDPLRYRIHLDIVKRRAVPLLTALHTAQTAVHVPSEWIVAVLRKYQDLTASLNAAIRAGSRRYASFSLVVRHTPEIQLTTAML